MVAILLALISQALFTTGDTLAREHLRNHNLDNLWQWWFVAYNLLRLVATGIQLWILSTVQLGTTYIIYAIAALVISQIVGAARLGEPVTIHNVIAMVLVIIATVVISMK